MDGMLTEPKVIIDAMRFTYQKRKRSFRRTHYNFLETILKYHFDHQRKMQVSQQQNLSMQSEILHRQHRLHTSGTLKWQY